MNSALIDAWYLRHQMLFVHAHLALASHRKSYSWSLNLEVQVSHQQLIRKLIQARNG